MPPNVYGQINTKSSTGEHGIVTVAGVIDPDYRGEILVCLHNMGNSDYKIQRGKPIAQMIFLPHHKPAIREVALGELTATERGTGGFGSTHTAVAVAVVAGTGKAGDASTVTTTVAENEELRQALPLNLEIIGIDKHRREAKRLGHATRSQCPINPHGVPAQYHVPVSKARWERPSKASCVTEDRWDTALWSDWSSNPPNSVFSHAFSRGWYASSEYVAVGAGTDKIGGAQTPGDNSSKLNAPFNVGVILASKSAG